MSSLEQEQKAMIALAGQNPKQVFVNCIVVPYIRLIDRLLATDPLAAIQWMTIFMSDLEDDDRTVLKKECEELQCLWTNSNYRSKEYCARYPYARAPKLYIIDLWQRIKAHVHIYYLREFGIRARNPNPLPIKSEGQPANPNPSHIGEQPK